MSKSSLYIFLDEAGNFDFTSSGTKYFVLSAVSKERPFEAYKELSELKYDMIEEGLNVEYFHATEDMQKVRDKVFSVIRTHISSIRVDSIIIEKRKTGFSLQKAEAFYPKMMGYLLRYIVEGYDMSRFREVLVFTDRIPVNRKRKAVEKTVKTTLKNMLPNDISYRVFHHDSKSNFDLQIADYCNWAIYRKWSKGDERSYDHIRDAVKSEFDIFRSGTRLYY